MTDKQATLCVRVYADSLLIAEMMDDRVACAILNAAILGTGIGIIMDKRMHDISEATETPDHGEVK